MTKLKYFAVSLHVHLLEDKIMFALSWHELQIELDLSHA